MLGTSPYLPLHTRMLLGVKPQAKVLVLVPTISLAGQQVEAGSHQCGEFV